MKPRENNQHLVLDPEDGLLIDRIFPLIEQSFV